ncbi:MAG: NADPH-dependent F420 reductase [Candidatus Gagatemarchaeaceae archaeon]
MKVAIFGGTGKIGMGLAEQLSKSHSILIASRDPAKARAAAARVSGATGADYLTAAAECEVAIAALPYSAIGSVTPLASPLAGKVVISIINPIRVEGGVLVFGLEGGSAAQELAAKLSKSRVATAFNNIPVAFFRREEMVRLDVLIAADSPQTFDEAASLVRSIPNLRPLHAGPLSEAGSVERITPVVLNLAKMNGTGSLAPRFVSEKD